MVQDECIYMKGPLCHHVHVGIKHSIHLFGAGMTLRQLLVQQCFLGRGKCSEPGYQAWEHQNLGKQLAVNFAMMTS